MKNLTKIFMVVVVGMLAFSCVTDTTNDLAPELGLESRGQHSLTLSLEESRTHLGEKVDGLYSLYWSEGDAIAVNGVISTPLSLEAAGEQVAIFSFGENSVQRPYCVVYPAPEVMPIEESGEDVSEPEPEPSEPQPEPTPEPEPTLPANVYPVTFAPLQVWANGTFAPQSAPMYGYADVVGEGEVGTIQMQHLSGVLRVAVKGDVTLASMTVTAGGKISGMFLVDCKTGTLTPCDDALNAVQVVFPEGGLALNAEEATPIYVAVPAGEHGVYTITLVSTADTDNTMVVRFNSDLHPVKAGVVKEFTEFVFTPNAADPVEGELVISTEADLRKLAAMSEVEQLGGVTTIKLGATIDMTGKNWNPIELLPTHVVFDGQMDLGYSIKGLTAPLFNTTAATIQNLNLTDVAIVETEQRWCGSIARGFYGTMTNCKASGSLEANNTTNASTVGLSSYNVINLGGLVGQAGGATFTDCENRVNITVTSLTNDEVETRGIYCAAGGIVGGAHSQSVFRNADNYGTIKLDTKSEDRNTYYNVAGIVGHVITNVDVTPYVKSVTYCDNHGDVYTAEGSYNATLTMGGILSNMPAGMEFNNNTNRGEISNNGTKTGNIYLSGIVAYINESPVVSCTNYAPITNNAPSSSGLHMGGIVGHDSKAAITGCTNDTNAAITNNGDIAGNVYVAGITGCDNGLRDGYNLDPEECKISGCYNKAPIKHTAVGKAVFISGIHARTAGVNIEDCHNTGAITHIGKPYDGGHNNCYVAGICGIDSKDVVNCTNNAPITVGGETQLLVSGFCINGIANKINGTISGCRNLENGDITVNNVLGSSNINIFGVCTSSYDAPSDKNWTISDCENKGDISVGETASVTSGSSASNPGETYIGGCVGSANNPISSCTNSGAITVGNVVAKSQLYVSGAVYNAAKGATSCTNSGSITVKGVTPSVETYIAGVLNTGTTMSGCSNSGAIKIGDSESSKTTFSKALYVAGVTNTPSQALSDCDNGGPMTVENISYATTSYFSGVVNNAVNGATDCDNSGNITFASSVSATATTCISGVVYKNNGELNTCTNTGAITVGDETTASTYKNFYASGIVTDAQSRLVSCENMASGDISITNATVAQLYVGGVAGIAYLTSTDSDTKKWSSNINRGDVTLKGVSSNTSAQYVSGMAGCVSSLTGATASNLTEWYQCKNYGNISLTNHTAAVGSNAKSGRLLVSGLFGYAAATFNINECENHGAVSVVNAKNGTNTFVGGIVGQLNKHNTINPNFEIKNCTNRGAISGSAVKLTGGAEATSSSEGFFLGGIIAGVWHSKDGVDYEHYYTGLRNYGTVTLGGSYFVSSKRECLGGIMGDIVGYGKFSDCYNEGAVTFEPTVNGETLTSVTANVRMGGIIGSTNGTTPTNSAVPTFTFEYCTNAGAVTVNKHTAKSYILAGGVGGYMSNHGATTYNISNCGNSGKILYDGVTTTNQNMYAGGVFAYFADANTTVAAENSRLVNIGNIEMNNCSLTDANTWVGGVVARTVVPVPNGESYCDIQAPGFTQVGWITGTARTSSILATKGKVYATPQLVWNDDRKKYDEEEPVFDDSNFMDYIYGGSTDWTGTTNYDGCTYLNVKPELPARATPDSGEGNEGTETPATPGA